MHVGTPTSEPILADREGKTGVERGCVCGCITLIAGRGPLRRTQEAGADENVETRMPRLRDEDGEGREPTRNGRVRALFAK